MMNSSQLLRVDQTIPVHFQHVFPFTYFNKMQSQVLDTILSSDENVIVSAPSGSGKTVVLELAICHALMRHGPKGLKCVYIAPNKALCQQRWTDWHSRFSTLGLTVLEVTGDSDVQNCLNLISKAAIIITTPEKWDCLTRCWRNHTFVLCGINLLLLDEIHHLAEEERGGVLESVIVRMLLVAKTKGLNISLRVVALSATLPNIEDVGIWLGCHPSTILQFDESYRPVPLEIKTISYPDKSNPFLFERSLEPKVKEIILRYGDGKQCIVFCSSKRNAENQALKLSEQHTIPFRQPPSTLTCELAAISNPTLRTLAQQGYGFHHSGLSPDDRTIIEHLFSCGYIQILCSTTTLAQGMNLPAHLVVIKGTNSWRGSDKGYENISRSDVIQMLGRAGRPGYDVQGKAVIMTSRENESYYAGIGLNAEIVESKLRNMVVEVIAAEISQYTITNLADCIVWMKSTLFAISLKKQLRKNMGEAAAVQLLNQQLQELSIKALSSLAEQRLIEFTSSTSVVPLPEVHVMSRHLTRFSSMLLLMKMESNSDLLSVLKTLAECEETHKPIRKSDKKTLNGFSRQVRFPLNAKIQSPDQKAFVLLQAVVSSKFQISDFNLRIEQAEVVEKSIRLLRALHELSIIKGWGRTLESTILLDRALNTRLWEWKHTNVFSQCPNLSADILEKLSEAGMLSFQSVEGLNPMLLARQIDCSESIAGDIIRFAALASKSQRFLVLSERDQMLTIQVQAPPRETTTFQLNYELVGYDSKTGQLLCHRVIPSNSDETINFTVRLETQGQFNHVKCGLFASMVGLDFIVHPKASVLSFTEERPDTETTSATGESARSRKKRKIDSTHSASLTQSPFEAFKCRDPSIPFISSQKMQETPQIDQNLHQRILQNLSLPLSNKISWKLKFASATDFSSSDFIPQDMTTEIDSIQRSPGQQPTGFEPKNEFDLAFL